MIVSLKKQKSAICAISSGFLFALSWPSSGFPFLIFFAFIPLLSYIESNPSPKLFDIFRVSFFAFLLWNASAAWWMIKYHFVGGSMVILINSFLMAIVIATFGFLKQKKIAGNKKYIAFVALWLTMEWMHMHWDLSWPWLTLGNAFATHPKLIQWYSYTGVFGGSLWILVSNILLFNFFEKAKTKKISFSLIILLILTLSIIFIPILLSFKLLNKENSNKLEELNCLLIQQNTNPYNEKESFTVINNRLISMVKDNIDTTTQLVILPETAIANEINVEKIEKNQEISEFIALQNQYPKASFLVGATTYSNDSRDKKTYNSAIYIGKNGKIETYHKSKLVPGVEEYPFKWITIPIIKWITGNVYDKKYSSGDKQSCFSTNDSTSKIAVAICYESLYGSYISKFFNKGANAIVLITNDGWWDNTDGYRQHLAISQIRAIENSSTMVRVANTGISAIINANGLIDSQTEWDKQTTLKKTIKMKTKLTFYEIYGDFILTIANLITLFYGLLVFSASIQKLGKLRQL